MRWKLSAIIFLTALLLTGCKGRIPDQNKSVSGKVFTDATGKQIQLILPPQRIISLAPSLTESMYQLGVQDRIAGVTVYCAHPPEARKKEKVGSVFSPNIERITELSPDLILATKDINKPKTIDKLRSLGFKVFVFDSRKSFSDVCDSFLLLGRLLDKEKRAIEIVKNARKSVETIESKVHGKQQPKVFWQVGSKPLVTVAKGTFADEMISMAGGINIAHESKIGYPRYSLEVVVKQNPDAIIIVTMGDITEQAKHTWQAFENLKAVKDNRIHVTDAHSVCAPSPVSFAEGLLEIAAFLHPDEFKK